jgi:hypothetical protein
LIEISLKGFEIKNAFSYVKADPRVGLKTKKGYCDNEVLPGIVANVAFIIQVFVFLSVVVMVCCKEFI